MSAALAEGSGHRRAGGILLHPTSLPGPPAIGELGPQAMRWIDWLAAGDCRLWQILPLVPTGFANSPYDGLSAFAGNPMLISLRLLAEQGLLGEQDLPPDGSEGTVDYDQLQGEKAPRLEAAASSFARRAGDELRREYQRFCNSQRYWIDDFALFMAIRNEHDGAVWTAWDRPLSRREPAALDGFRRQHQRQVDSHKVLQFLFYRQWEAIHRAASEHGISIIGDLPIFVSHDSADVWAHPEYFQLGPSGAPRVVAGVPPDYFSPTGQRWGNPVYQWQALADDGYRWWVERVRMALSMVDVIRLDHFRGFLAAWEIPASSPTAEVGAWVDGPGTRLFQSMRQQLGPLPCIAEDLGVVNGLIHRMRDDLGFPGMKVLQFGLEGGADHEFLPHKYPIHCVAYTGTHDNDTSHGWFQQASEEVRRFTQGYLPGNGPVSWRMIESIWASQAERAIAPMQDFLDLDGAARMNTPGTLEGNWSWRMADSRLTDGLAERIRDLNERNQR